MGGQPMAASAVKVWCTFAEEQIDIDVFSKLGRDFIDNELKNLCTRGANLIRLDAFGYTTKKRGTNCFFVEPEVWDLLDHVRDSIGKSGTELLCEVHEHYGMQKRLAQAGFWVYDFALPMLTLQALYDGDANNLKAWLLKCPRNQIVTLDTHDGIGVVDVADLMTQQQIDRTKENIFEHGANANMRYNSSEYGNLDIYQINCTYYSAVGNRDAWYLLARAIQLFTPGIPLIYYVGLLAGANDTELAEATKTGRDINRHPYTLDEAIQETDRPVVKALFELCRFRNSHPAFNGIFELLDTSPDIQDSVVLLMPPQADEHLGPQASMEAHDRVVKDASGHTYEVREVPQGAVKDESYFLDTLSGVTQDFEDPKSIPEDTNWPVDKILTGTLDLRCLRTKDDNAYAAAQRAERRIAEHDEREGPCTTDASSAKRAVAGIMANEVQKGGESEVQQPSSEDQRKVDQAEEDFYSSLGTLDEMQARGYSTANHDAAEDMLLSTQERMFRPYSAALVNLNDRSCMKTPVEETADSPLTPLEQVRAIRRALQRDPQRDLPRSVLCCKWTNGDYWAVLEADLAQKDFRILYVDPFDGRQKVWNVTQTLEAHKENAA